MLANSPSASNRPYQARPRRLKQVHSGGKWPADRGESGPYLLWIIVCEQAAVPATAGLTQTASPPPGAGHCIPSATAFDFLYDALTERFADRRERTGISGNHGRNRRFGEPTGAYCAALSPRPQADKNRTPAPARRRAPGPGRDAASRLPPIRAGRFAPGIRDSRSDSRHCRGADLTV